MVSAAEVNLGKNNRKTSIMSAWEDSIPSHISMCEFACNQLRVVKKEQWTISARISLTFFSKHQFPSGILDPIHYPWTSVSLVSSTSSQNVQIIFHFLILQSILQISIYRCIVSLQALDFLCVIIAKPSRRPPFLYLTNNISRALLSMNTLCPLEPE